MGKYDRDRRVRRGPGKGYTVTDDSGQQYQVLPTEVFGWCIFAGTGHNPQMAQDGKGNLAYGFSSSDAAIGALLSKPARGRRR